MPPEENGFQIQSFDDISRFCGYMERAVKDIDGDIKEMKKIMTGFQESVGTLRLKVAGIGAIVSLLISVLFLIVKTLVAK